LRNSAIVGSSGSPTWSDTAVAYATFYHLIAKGEYVVDAVSAMRVASGVDTFFVTTAEEARQGYLDFIKKLNAGEVQEELQQEGEKEKPSEMAKMTKLERPEL
jgi:hypothetical protein